MLKILLKAKQGSNIIQSTKESKTCEKKNRFEVSIKKIFAALKK